MHIATNITGLTISNDSNGVWLNFTTSTDKFATICLSELMNMAPNINNARILDWCKETIEKYNKETYEKFG